MFKRKICLISIVLVLFFTVSCVYAAHDNLTLENDNNIKLEDTCENIQLNNSFNNLNNLVNGNLNESEIKFEEDYIHSLDDSFSEGININRSLTIDGQGHMIDAKMKSRIFIITAKNVTLKNINFVNGNGKLDLGGAICFTKNSTGLIINSTFINNRAWYGGAVAYDENSSGVVINSTFINNGAGYGSALYQDFNSKTLIKNCIFDNNSACESSVYGDGGAIVYGSNTTSIIENSIFVNNSATLHGGAIRFGWYSNVFINNSSFRDNSANYGGALYHMDYSNTTILNSFFTNNNANNGGAIYYYWYYSTILNSSFINNAAEDKGGAIYYWRGFKNLVNDSIFIKNSASFGGGVFYRDRSKGIINNSIFIENMADCGGGICYLNQSTKSMVLNSLFVRNYAKNKSGTYGGVNYNCTIIKLNPKLTVNKLICSYNQNKYLTVTLKDQNNLPIENELITIGIKGNLKTFKTNSNGQVFLSTKNLQASSYNALISFNGNDNFEKSKITSNIIIKKASVKLIAKKKTFNIKMKNKVYSIILKDNNFNKLSNLKVMLKIKGKTYKTATKNNGKAIFKIKLNKKGNYKATIKFKGNKNYKSITKKIKIKIK